MTENRRFYKLLAPGRIGQVTTRNRIVKTTSSMGYQYNEKDGHITEKQLYFSEAIARGGVGLVITEGGIFDWPLGAHDVFHYRIDDDEYIPGWARLAEFLVKRGRNVTIIAGDEPIAEGLPQRKQQRLVDWLGEKAVTIITGAKCEEITAKGLVITTKDGVRQLIEADTITPALPFRPDSRLFDALKGQVPEIHLIGDGAEPRLIIDAIADGWRVAKNGT